jgi:hypothetical protein
VASITCLSGLASDTKLVETPSVLRQLIAAGEVS